MTKEPIFYVYVLFHPRTGAPFYVGKGCRDRWLTHGKTTHNSWKNNIIRKAKRDGIAIPRIKIAENLTEAEAFEREIVFIKAIGRQPVGPLVNKVDGGGGTSGKVYSKVERKRISDATKRAMARPEVKERQSKALKIVFNTPELRTKMSAIVTKQMSDPTRRAAIGDLHRGRIRTPEERAKIGAAGGGRVVSAATRAAISVGLKGRIVSKETREKLRQAGLNISDETRAKRGRAVSVALNAPEVKAKWIASIKAAMQRPEVRTKLTKKRA